MVEPATNSCRNPSRGSANHSTGGNIEGANSNTATADATPPPASGRAELDDASDGARQPDKPDNASATNSAHDTTAMANTKPGRASPTKLSAAVDATKPGVHWRDAHNASHATTTTFPDHPLRRTGYGVPRGNASQPIASS